MNTLENEKSAENGGKFLDDKTDEEHIKELALLTTFEYDRARNEKAQELGVQISTLDKAVKEARKDVEISRMNVSPPDPWDKEIQGEALLNEIVFTINRFLKVGKHEATAIALWIMFTYVYLHMRICPILLATSSEKRCGKTLLLSLLIKLSNKAMPSSNISPSSLFRAIEKWGWTLLIDEADRSLKYNDELLGIINSGQSLPTISAMVNNGSQLSADLSCKLSGMSGICFFKLSILSCDHLIHFLFISVPSKSLNLSTCSPGFFLNILMMIDLSSAVSFILPIPAIAFGPHVEKHLGS